MKAADTLCDSIFRWLENREKCAQELLELAIEPENVHQRSNIALVFRASVSAAVLDSVCPTSTAKEAGVSSSAFNKAIELIKEDEKVGMIIQKLLRDLKDRCGETQKDRCGETLKDRCAEAPLGAHADELDCEILTLLMCALARRSNTHVPLDFLRGFNRATFFRHMTTGGLAPDEAMRFICKALGLDCSPEITTSLKVLAKYMMKNIELIGIKASNEARSRCATGVGISVCDLIVKSEELVKDNRVTEASKILWDSAREILDSQQRLKEQLDGMNEIIQKLLQMKSLVENLGGYSLSMDENGQRIIHYIMGTCTDNTVLSWLQGLPNQNEFVKLLQFVLDNLIPTLKDISTPVGGHIDIIFVGHGRIVDQFMPARGLVPTLNIRDTILYSPWNCAINANAAYAIAQGLIQKKVREFTHMAYCEPNPLPDYLNSMRRSLHNIPEILLAPLTPEDGQWARIQQLLIDAMDLLDRVIIPYVVPQDWVNAYGEIPLHMFIFATSFILSIEGKTATVHLAACLGREGSPPRPEEWRTQYAYTSDETMMTVNLGDMNPEFFRDFRSLFDRDRR